jgi:thiamine pyrophosphate-dependent acetolactate synthase large subunit-like protein
MTEINGGQAAARQLRASGIDTMFGVVAGPMIELYGGAHEAGLKVVGCRHELNGGFMASAWGYQKKKPGVLVVGSGPALTNALTPLYVATESAMPLVVLGGSAFANTRGVGGFQELDQVSAARPVCKWTGQVDSTERIGEWIHLALGKALEGRPGGVYLDFPGQVVSRKIAEEKLVLRSAPEVTRAHPDPAALVRTADWLESAERPLILVGKGAAWADAGPAIRKLVDLGIPYVASPMARGTVPDDHPNFANGARSHALAEADVIVMLGGRFNWIFGMGRRFAPGAKLVHVDVAAEEMYSGANVALGIVGDAALAAEGLVAALAGRKLRSAKSGWLSVLREQSRKNDEAVAKVLADDSIPINPYRLVAEVRAALPRDTIVTSEGETIMGICRMLLPSYVSRGCLNAGTTGCMGVGAPYAVGAKLARPDLPSVAVLGDYAFGAAAMVVETARRVGAAPVLIVANNEGIAGHMIQDALMPAGAPRIAALLPARYEKLAEMVDGHAEYVERPDGIRPAIDRALGADCISVVHVRMDPKAARVSGSNYLQ